MDEKKQPVNDMAETLRQYSEVRTTTQQPPRFKLSARNQRKLQLIRERVQQMRGGL